MTPPSAPVPSLDDRGLPVGYPFKREYEVTPRELKQLLEREPTSIVLVDCRTSAERDAARIEGSVHIPLDELERRHDEIDVAEHQQLAVICHHGVRSMKGALMLRALGYPGAVSVAGGIDLWSIAADTSVPRYERGPAGCRRVP